MKKLNEKLWPNLLSIFENRIDELNCEIDLKKRIINSCLKESKVSCPYELKGIEYKTKFDNYNNDLIKLANELAEFNSAIHILNLKSEFEHPFIPGANDIENFEIMNYFKDNKDLRIKTTDKLYLGSLENSEDLNDN